jgi:hypothetical protein
MSAQREHAPVEVDRVDDDLVVELDREHPPHDLTRPQWVQLRVGQHDVVRLAPDEQPPFGLDGLSEGRMRRLVEIVEEARRRAFVHGPGLV